MDVKSRIWGSLQLILKERQVMISGSAFKLFCQGFGSRISCTNKDSHLKLPGDNTPIAFGKIKV